MSELPFWIRIRLSTEADVVSAHRMPEEMLGYGRDAAGRGLSVIIAGAGAEDGVNRFLAAHRTGAGNNESKKVKM